MGTYLGIRHRGRLIALAGERLHPPGWTEISAVCTDPAYRGRGLATRLVRAVAAGIKERDEWPFLHAAADNTNAIRLYESIGFTLRRRTVFSLVRTPESPPWKKRHSRAVVLVEGDCADRSDGGATRDTCTPRRPPPLPAPHRPPARGRRALLLLTPFPQPPCAPVPRAGDLVRTSRKAPSRVPHSTSRFSAPPLHLAVALDGTGWHPASWREPVARPRDLFTAGYWADLVAEAERGLLDFVTIEDGLGLQSSQFARAGRAHRPGARPPRRRADRLPRRPADPAHRPGADRGRHPHGAVPPLQGDRHPRLRQLRPRGPAGADLRPPARGRRTSAAAPSRRST